VENKPEGNGTGAFAPDISMLCWPPNVRIPTWPFGLPDHPRTYCNLQQLPAVPATPI